MDIKYHLQFRKGGYRISAGIYGDYLGGGIMLCSSVLKQFSLLGGKIRFSHSSEGFAQPVFLPGVAKWKVCLRFTQPVLSSGGEIKVCST